MYPSDFMLTLHALARLEWLANERAISNEAARNAWLCAQMRAYPHNASEFRPHPAGNGLGQYVGPVFLGPGFADASPDERRANFRVITGGKDN